MVLTHFLGKKINTIKKNVDILLQVSKEIDLEADTDKLKTLIQNETKT
jgi:hypothetical protein